MTALRTCIVTTLLSVSVATAVGAQFERQMGGLGLEVFEDKNFKGRSATFLQSTPDLRSSGMDGRISSLRVASGEATKSESFDFGGAEFAPWVLGATM